MPHSLEPRRGFVQVCDSKCLLLVESDTYKEKKIAMSASVNLSHLYRNLARWSVKCGLFIALAAVPVYADSPWEQAVNVLTNAFTTTIARGLSLVAIVIGGLTFAYGEGDAKRTIAGILFGVGMAVSAGNFLAWLFS